MSFVPPILEVEDLHVTFKVHGGDVHALRGAWLKIAPGEIVGLVGESGSGKSVLGLTALGLLPTHPRPLVSGSVFLADEDMVKASEDARRKRRGSDLGAIFQDPMTSLNPTMRVGHQVAEAAGGADDERVHQLLADTGIPEPAVKARCYPHELSGGQRQRVMIAMALARDPKLVVADEPTTALDVTVQAVVLDLLAKLVRERNMALLFVTHDLGVAARICDRIAVAYAGRIVESGTAAEVLGGARHPYTIGLLASRPRLDGAIAGGDLPTLAGRPPDPRRAAARLRVRAALPGRPTRSASCACPSTATATAATSATTPACSGAGLRAGPAPGCPTRSCCAPRPPPTRRRS